MYLSQVIAYINDERKKLEFEKLNTTINIKRAALLSILEKVTLFLVESEDGLKLDNVREALECLEKIIIEEKKPSGFGFFNKKTYRTSGEIIKDENYPVLMNQTKIIDPITEGALSIHEHRILAAIHIALMKCYSKVKWSFVYPAQASDEISSIIKQWEVERLNLASSPLAHVDFLRSICIMHAISKSTEDIHAKLYSLVNKAHHYRSRKEKSLLMEWLEKNGGQDNSRFITQLFANNFFIPQTYLGLTPTIGIANDVISQDWHIKNGKICLKFDTAIRTIQYGGEAIIITTADGKTGMLKGMDEIGNALEKNKRPPALLRVAGKIVLEIIDDIVNPKVQAFTVLCFNDYLLNPVTTIVDRENLLEKKPSLKGA